MMILIMRKDAAPSQLTNVVAKIEQMGCQAHISHGEQRTLVGIIGNGRPFETGKLEQMPGVEKTMPVTRPFKRASREFHPQDTHVAIGDTVVGGPEVVMIAGPCAVESQEQMSETGQAIKQAGAQIAAAKKLLTKNPSCIKSIQDGGIHAKQAKLEGRG